MTRVFSPTRAHRVLVRQVNPRVGQQRGQLVFEPMLSGRIVAFQFHLETTPESAAALIENCAGELDGTTHVQSAEEMMRDPGKFIMINGVMKSVLESLSDLTT